jgi:ZIP family zinc transporter
MQIVLITALGVGGATVIGSLMGFIFKKISHRFSDIVLAFAAGVMMAAAVIGLILEAIECGGKFALPITIAGIFLGALTIHLLDGLVPHLHRLTGVSEDTDETSRDKLYKVILFVCAIAIHNFPEGIAAGVGFGTGNTAEALTIAGAIALQNIPEGMVIIAPMLSSGISPARTFIAAISTGIIEVVGTLIGYYAVSISAAILPFALAFAGGTMLYVISNDMIPETHAHGSHTGATYSLLAGFCLMLVMDYYL